MGGLLAFLFSIHFRIRCHFLYYCFIVFWTFLLFVLSFASNLAAEITGTPAGSFSFYCPGWTYSPRCLSKEGRPQNKNPDNENKENLHSLTYEQAKQRILPLLSSVHRLPPVSFNIYDSNVCKGIILICVQPSALHGCVLRLASGTSLTPSVLFGSSWLWLSPSSALLFTPQEPPGHYSSE